MFYICSPIVSKSRDLVEYVKEKVGNGLKSRHFYNSKINIAAWSSW